VNPVIIKNTKNTKNTGPNYKNNTTIMRKHHQQKENTTYIDGFAVLFFDGMSKERKNTKGQSAICEGLEKYKKHTKIQIAFLDVM